MAGFAGTTFRRLRSSWSVQTGTDLHPKQTSTAPRRESAKSAPNRTRAPFIKQQMIDIAQKWHTLGAAYEDQYGRTRIKHDGFRLMARRDPVGIRLITRGGHDWLLLRLPPTGGRGG